MYVYFCQVFDGDNENFPLVGTFCGNFVPAHFVSSGNFLTIRFVTDSSVQRRGFNATYSAVPRKTPPTPLLLCTLLHKENSVTLKHFHFYISSKLHFLQCFRLNLELLEFWKTCDQ